MCSRFAATAAAAFAALSLVAHVCSAHQPNVQQQQQQPFMQFTPKDYRMINELALADHKASLIANNHKPKAPIKKFVAPKRNLGYLSQFLEPPAPDSLSEYAKFFHYPKHKKQQQQQIDALPKNHRPYYAKTQIKEPVKKVPKIQNPIRDHAPINQTEPESEATAESTANVKKKVGKKESSKSLELSPDGDRVEFQMQGHDGPKTYIFGFDTGDGKNRQFRLEERSKDGTVKGHYGYYDARGKLRTIRYLARPFEGYREKHHESSDFSNESE